MLAALLMPALARGGLPARIPEHAAEQGLAGSEGGAMPATVPTVVATAGAEPGWLAGLGTLPADPALLTLALAIGGLVWMRRRTV